MNPDDFVERAKQCLKVAAETMDTDLKASPTEAAHRWETARG
jgi:hypothetical protein